MKFQWKTPFAQRIFKQKYSISASDDWPNLAERLVEDVCGSRWGTRMKLMSDGDRKQLQEYITKMAFVPGGRYLYYAGRPLHFYNNCFCLRAEEDTREEWGRLLNRASDCLMSGGGIGVDYSRLRASGKVLQRTGGISSGPVPLMQSINEVGRNVMQGGSRRSAIFASLNWQHEDSADFIRVKNWSEDIKALKAKDFNFPAPLDMTNISVGLDDDFFKQEKTPQLFYDVVKGMCQTAEPGFTINIGKNSEDILRNACAEFTSEDDSDVCNLGSINLGNISSIEELYAVVNLAAKFLVCGTIRGDVPYQKVADVREQNRKIGLGLMGIHEWLLKRGYQYEVVPELKEWLEVYRSESERGANELCDRFYLSRPKKYRALAPTG